MKIKHHLQQCVHANRLRLSYDDDMNNWAVPDNNVSTASS